MATWTVSENGRFENGVVRHNLTIQGQIVGEFDYLAAQAHVMTNGKPDDTYIEEYEGNMPSVTLTVQKVIDAETKWQEMIASQ